MVSLNFTRGANVPPELVSWVCNRQVTDHLRSVPHMVAGHLLNLFVILVSLYGSVNHTILAALSAVVLLACVHRYRMAVTTSRRADEPEKVQRSLDLNSLALGLALGALFFWAMPQVGPGQQLLLAISGVTQVAAAGLTIRTLVRSAHLYIFFVSTGFQLGLLAAGGFSNAGAFLLVGGATGLLWNMVHHFNRLFVARILDERRLSNSTATVKMLLNDYESQGSDWLFELDGEGRMLNVNERFAEAAGQRAENMNGRSFASLFVDSPALDQLSDNLASRQAWRGLNLLVKSETIGAERWWSIAARPAVMTIDSPTRFRGVVSDISTEKQAEARVRHMAHYDSLTELPNRLMFNSALNRVLAERPSKSRIALLLIDFDHFKSINDMYGHPTGDAFLKQVGARMLDCVTNSGLGGEGGIVARLGGDEFAIFIVGEDVVDQSIRLSELLIAEFATVCEVEGHEVHSGISIGVAVAPDHADSSATLLSQADIALYVAKDEGRGRWDMFQPGMDKELQKRHELARDLRQALGNNELRLFLQPLVNVESGKSSGFEALMRWEHPVRGMVMPNDFIPVAEETGLIVQMGEWAIRTALAEAASWAEPHSIAINISPVQMHSNNLVPTVMNALATTGIDPGRVELEITESVLLHDSEANIEILNRLHTLGVKIALDDFGTGYASLNYLLTFPFDKIKIDRSFVTDLEHREESRAIVGAVISLANQLGMCTLAEGVEHEAQLAQLRADGCEMVQGWLFGKAMPADHYAGLRAVLDEAPVVEVPLLTIKPRKVA